MSYYNSKNPKICKRFVFILVNMYFVSHAYILLTFSVNNNDFSLEIRNAYLLE